MVPPWNRIDAALAERLPGLGFAALSTYQARTTATAAPGLVQTNCHLDILRWKPERRFLGTEASLGLLTAHLAAKRSEEHTSELQSLMRISYAVFCLKKKNHNHNSKFIKHTQHNTTNKHT